MNSPASIQGVWQSTSAIISGDALPPEMVDTIRLTLTATRFTTQRGEEILFDSSYTIDPSRTPMEIEMLGTGGDFAGQRALGIYALAGDLLRLCYKMPGCPRPTGFLSEPGSGAFLITLRRLQN